MKSGDENSPSSFWGEFELFLGIWGAKTNTFRGTRKSYVGIWGDQCIIFRDQGNTDPPGGGGGGGGAHD